MYNWMKTFFRGGYSWWGTLALLGIFLFMGGGIFFGCDPARPMVPDGSARIELVVMDSSGLTSTGRLRVPAPVPEAEVVLLSEEYRPPLQLYTDNQGKIVARGLPASVYRISARYQVNSAYRLSGLLEMEVGPQAFVQDTIYIAPQPLPPLLINEVYYCGPPGANGLFFDQFIELINPGDTTVYLDGKIVGRCSGFDAVISQVDSVDYLTAIYAFRFPGEPGGHTLPVLPGEVVVLACDAMNFRAINPHSVNLEQADFEFYNQFGQDMDNPQVPNLENMIYEGNNDFLINRKSDAVFIASGRVWQKVEMVFPYGSEFFLQIPLKEIIDAVEYKASTGTPKILTRRLDAGFTGYGVTSFSGKSIARRGLQDLNDSSVDFQVLEHPTPFEP